jgi:hypothetical protein
MKKAKQLKQIADKEAKQEVAQHVKTMHKGQKMAAGGGVKIRGTGAATKGTRARGPMG